MDLPGSNTGLYSRIGTGGRSAAAVAALRNLGRLPDPGKMNKFGDNLNPRYRDIRAMEKHNPMINHHLFLAALVTILLAACTDGRSQESATPSDDPAAQAGDAGIEQLLQQSMQGVEPIRYHEFIDPNSGLVQARYPIPRSWRVHSVEAPVYMEGEDGLRVHKSESRALAWSNNPMMQQTLQMQGQTLAPPVSARQVLNDYVRPNAENQGYRLLDTYELPEVAGLWQRLMHAMPNTGSQREVEALGSEWQTDRGTRSLILLVRYQITNQQAVMWNITTTEVEAPAPAFPAAKNAYLYSLANAQLNPQWIQYMNRQLQGNIRKNDEFWAQASAQSAAAHRQRMQAIADRGNAARSAADTYSDILDISHQGYLNRSNINSAGHDKTIRGISETALIGNHETGEHYTVPAGSRYYWVANDGSYIGTDNALLNPNTTRQLNEKDWTKFAVEQ